jgi:hypothetical protein
MSKIAKKTSFLTAFITFSVLAPVLLVMYGYETAPDSVARAQFCVQALERLVFALAAVAMARFAFVSFIKGGLLSAGSSAQARSVTTSA